MSRPGPAGGGPGATASDGGPPAPALEVHESGSASVGALAVRRVLPRRRRRSIGPWCFLDHLGPAWVAEQGGLDVGPHPHMGLQTVTWLLAGEALHRDSLGTEQVIRPGQLNLMTAGHGVAHAEEATGSYRGELHGVQLWVAQPEATRHGPPAFEHHGALPCVELTAAVATVLVGELDGVRSPARRDGDHVGVDLVLHRGTSVVPLRVGHEHGLVVVAGAVELDGTLLVPGQLAYLAPGRSECRLNASTPARALLVGGTPLQEQLVLWWNFVARRRDELVEAHRAWSTDDGRFGTVASSLARCAAPLPPWQPMARRPDGPGSPAGGGRGGGRGGGADGGAQ